jgi:hypothetical protein
MTGRENRHEKANVRLLTAQSVGNSGTFFRHFDRAPMRVAATAAAST